MGEAAALKTPVLVLGATSLVGRFVLPRLAGTPHVALSRTPPQGGAGTWIQADLAGPALEAALPVCPTVLSLLPIWMLPPALPALRARGMERLVAFSSTSVFTKPDSPVAAERDVARLLAEGEAAISAFCEAGGVAWTILRPTLIYAEGQDQNVSRLAKLIGKLGFLPLAGRGEGRRQPVHADDLAGAALAAAASEAARNKALDVPGGETLTYRRMAERVFEGLGRRPRILTIPPQVWTVGLRLAGPLLPGATAGMGARMSEDLVFDPEPARRAFGWAPREFRPRF
jgi:nucleoside-diphosphate-sugar epimerase